jgi:hypothetical protein
MQATHEIRAFDLLCACRRNYEVRAVSVYAAKNRLDLQEQAQLSAVLPRSVGLSIDTESHNVIHHLDRLGRLGAFYAKIFGEDAVSSTSI